MPNGIGASRRALFRAAREAAPRRPGLGAQLGAGLGGGILQGVLGQREEERELGREERAFEREALLRKLTPPKPVTPRLSPKDEAILKLQTINFGDSDKTLEDWKTLGLDKRFGKIGREDVPDVDTEGIGADTPFVPGEIAQGLGARVGRPPQIPLPGAPTAPELPLPTPAGIEAPTVFAPPTLPPAAEAQRAQFQAQIDKVKGRATPDQIRRDLAARLREINSPLTVDDFTF